MAVIAILGAVLTALTKALILALVVPATFVLGHVVWDCIKPIPRREN